MKRTALLMLAILSGLGTAVCGKAPEAGDASQTSGAQDQEYEVEWEPWCDFDDSIFPSFLIATAVMPTIEDKSTDIVLGDPKGRLGIVIHNAGGLDYRLTLKKNALMEESTVAGTIPDDADEAFIFPKVLFDYAALRRVHQPVPLNLVLSLELDGDEPEEQSMTVTVRSINELLQGRVFLTDEELDAPNAADLLTPDATQSFAWMFAAYVNENHPRIDQILKEAIQAGTVTSFFGYPENAEDEAVFQQVFAIWNVLQRRGVKYSSIDRTQTENRRLWSQHVRFLDEVIDNTQANCVDGTLVFASVLRKIGLNVGVVLVPEHMFLAFSTDAAGRNLYGLETTMVGHTDLASVGGNRTRNQVSRAAFNDALVEGSNELAKVKPLIDRNDRPLQYALVSINEARRMGVLPISFEGARR